MLNNIALDDLLGLQQAIITALSRSFADISQHEPQLVANLVWELPNSVNNLFLSGPTQIRAGGVFVHSRPLVKSASFKVDKSVEIGDLLLIRSLTRQGHTIERRALLLQAKKVTQIPANPDNPNQMNLYRHWPRFRYERCSGSLNGRSRKISEPDMYDAAKYLLITKEGVKRPIVPWSCICDYHPLHCPCTFGHLTAQPTSPLGRFRSIAAELIEFLLGNAGKVFSTSPSNKSGWDQVINDLINVTSSSCSVYMERAGGSSARGNAVRFMTCSKPSETYALTAFREGFDQDEGPPRVGETWVEEGMNGGISIIDFTIANDE
jgi:hypothetical protein